MGTLNTQNWLDIAKLGTQFGGGLLAGSQQSKESEANRQLTQQQQLVQNLLAQNQNNPYQQAHFSQQDAMRNALVGGAQNAGYNFDPKTGMGGFTGGMQIPQGGFGPNVMDKFQPSFTQGSADQFTNKLNNAISPPQAQAPPPGMEYDKKTGQLKKKGGGLGGFFKKLGKVALAAAPIVAAPFTGGATLAMIGAGAGAASGAMNGGGLKGALLGGAMGGLTSGATGNLAKNIGLGGSKAALAQSVAKSTPYLSPKVGQGLF